jgi:hypothetical protein
MSRKYKWRKDWAYCHALERLMMEEAVGTVLNLACGLAPGGDVRADLDDSVKPHVRCDLRKLPFKRNSFDTVYVDPPYKYFNHPGWLSQCFDIARKKVIIDDLPLDWKAGKKWDRRWMILTRETGMLLRTGAVYTRKDEQVSDYLGKPTP